MIISATSRSGGSSKVYLAACQRDIVVMGPDPVLALDVDHDQVSMVLRLVRMTFPDATAEAAVPSTSDLSAKPPTTAGI